MIDIVQQTSNVGLTLLVIVAAIILVRWLDRNVFNKGRFKDND